MVVVSSTNYLVSSKVVVCNAESTRRGAREKAPGAPARAPGAPARARPFGRENAVWVLGLLGFRRCCRHSTACCSTTYYETGPTSQVPALTTRRWATSPEASSPVPTQATLQVLADLFVPRRSLGHQAAILPDAGDARAEAGAWIYEN